MAITPYSPDPDRLLPSDPTVLPLARMIYGHIADRPILSLHGHVDAEMLAGNEPFRDPASLLITPDHYVLRLLHAAGVELGRLGVPARGGPAQPLTVDASREIWRILCSHWEYFLGTPVRFWLECELAGIFGVEVALDPETADDTFDKVREALASPRFRPQQLLRDFHLEVLATTDDPASSLDAHRRLAADEKITTRVIPTFRADACLDPAAPGWAANLTRLAEASGIDTGSYRGLLDALANRRAYFAEHGATSTDQSALSLECEPLDPADAEAIHARAIKGSASAAELAAYRADLLFRCADMSASDGLTMQLHAGVLRNHHLPTLDRFGPDTGHDLPTPTEFVRPLQPILNAFGTNSGFRLVLYTTDETAFSREIGPLAGFYPSVYAGAPWWFLDTPDAMLRYRQAITDSAGFYKTAGFVDDTRAFCSIPIRHDTARRADAGYLARLVADHRLTLESALAVAEDLTDRIPRTAFGL